MFLRMSANATAPTSRARRVRKNLRQGMALAWAASPRALVRYTVLGIVSSAMPPVAVYLGSVLVNRIADARVHTLHFSDMLPVVIGLWIATGADCFSEIEARHAHLRIRRQRHRRPPHD